MSGGYFKLRGVFMSKEKEKYIEELEQITDELDKFQHDAEDTLDGICMADVGEAVVILKRALDRA